MRQLFFLLLFLLVLMLFAGFSSVVLAQNPVNRSFFYQGWLQNGTTGVDGTCDFEFRLFDAASGGAQLGSTVSKTNVLVSNGYFSVTLDFGNVFTSTPRYLQVDNINCGNPGDPTSLTGRIPLYMPLAASYALTVENASAVDWANITGKPAGFADNQDDGLYILCANNQILRWTAGGWVCANIIDDHGNLTGLDSDDHPQYLLGNGTRAMNGALDLGGGQIVNLAQASGGGQAVTYEQVVKYGDAAGGDLTGTYPASLTAVGLQGRPVTSTTPAVNQALTWDGNQWTPADPQAVGAAGGDLSGSYPNPIIVALQGQAVANFTPFDKQALLWDDTNKYWEPANVLNPNDTASGDLSGSYPDPIVVGLQGRSVVNSAPGNNQALVWNNTANQWEPADVQYSGPIGGDLSGNYPDPTVVGLQGRPVASTSPLNKQILAWDGSQWKPSNVTHLQGQPVSVSAPATDQVLLWNGSQWIPSPVTTLQGRAVSSVSPASGQVLIWNGSQWAPSDVLKPGDGAGGDLSGAYPNPQLKPNTVGMNELNIPMGYGAGSGQFSAGSTTADLYILPTEASFTPSAAGQCLVTVSAYIKNTVSGYANDDPVPFLRTAKQVGSNEAAHDNSEPIWFAPDDVTRFQPIQASAGYVWPIASSEVGQSVTFGCYLSDPPGNWDSDETAYCRVSFLCQ